MKTNTWERERSDKTGAHFFVGQPFVSKGILEGLSPQEINFIILDVRLYARACDGIAALQSYMNDSGQKVLVIDQLTRQTLEDNKPPQWVKQNNGFTLILPGEFEKTLKKRKQQSIGC